MLPTHHRAGRAQPRSGFCSGCVDVPWLESSDSFVGTEALGLAECEFGVAVHSLCDYSLGDPLPGAKPVENELGVASKVLTHRRRFLLRRLTLR